MVNKLHQEHGKCAPATDVAVLQVRKIQMDHSLELQSVKAEFDAELRFIQVIRLDCYNCYQLSQKESQTKQQQVFQSKLEQLMLENNTLRAQLEFKKESNKSRHE